MMKRKSIAETGLAAPIWRWGTLFLSGLFIIFSIYLLVSIKSEQDEVKRNVHSISDLNKLRRSVRSLSLALTDTASISWSSLYENYKQGREKIDMKYAEALGYSRNIKNSDLYVAEMAALAPAGKIAGVMDDPKSFLINMNSSLDELERAIENIRGRQGMHSKTLSGKLTALGGLVFFACILAIFITVLFWKYQHDTSARRAAELALKEASAQVIDLYNNAPCGYHSINKHGVFADINDTELRWLGYSREEVIGKLSFSDVVTPESVEAFNKLYPVFIEKGKTSDLEFVMMRKDGSTFPVSLRATAIYDENGNYIKSRSTVMDITGRKMVEEENQNKNIAILNAYKKLEITARELEAVNKELESFSYSISHDLRAPLRAINAYSQIIEEEYSKSLDEEGLRLLGIVKGSAIKMGTLIDDLLAFARLGRQEVRKNVVDMSELVNATIRDLERNQQGVNVKFTIEDLPPAWGDYGLLTQVVYNLLSNAVKYSSNKPQPAVIVGARALAEEHVYFIKDNGAGFDMSYADKLFGVFQRLHHASEFEGTGVGLAIVHRIIIKHGGRVWAEAETGKGATFYFSLPVK